MPLIWDNMDIYGISWVNMEGQFIKALKAAFIHIFLKYTAPPKRGPKAPNKNFCLKTVDYGASLALNTGKHLKTPGLTKHSGSKLMKNARKTLYFPNPLFLLYFFEKIS